MILGFIAAQTPEPVASRPNDCETSATAICTWVLDHTGNDALATAVNWIVGVPLRVAGVLLVAWLVARLARWLVSRGVRRAILTPKAMTRQLGLDKSAPARADARLAGRASSLVTVAGSTVVVIIWVTATITAMKIIGVNIVPIVASAGIISVALGFGAQSLVKDCINGMFMLIEDHYGIGDTVNVGDAEGVVEEITLRATVLRGIDGTVWHIPNGEILLVGNRSQAWSMAIVDVEVAFGTDLAQAKHLMEQAAVATCATEQFADDVLEPPSVLGIESIGVTGIRLRLNVKTKPGKQIALQRALREDVKVAFDAAGIEPGPSSPKMASPGSPIAGVP